MKPPHEPPPLATPRLLLEPLRPEHAGRLFESMRDPAIYRFIPQTGPASVAALEALYRRFAAGPPSPRERWWNWAIVARDDPAGAVGTVQITLLEDGRRALLGYVFARASWGRGFAYEACRSVCEYLSAIPALREIEAHIDTRNERSIALAKRLGFAYGGRVDNADYFKGSASDEFVYRLALVKDDDGEAFRR